ncbi:hypothetical protein C2E23DRAFT_279550 [Lenzites betulinus]|nr:hypothetical protein C2E23DRAFT_279550 [Lenzites betulinus]
MKFFNVLSFIGAVALGALSVVAQDPTAVIAGIDDLTTQSQNLQTIVAAITPINAGFQAAKIAPKFLTITDDCARLAKTFTGNTEPYGASVATDVRIALVRFVQVHQLLLNTLIGKHGIIAKFPPFGSDIAFALRGLESIIDTFAYALIGLIPTEADTAQESINSLDMTFANACNVYGC